MKKFKFLVVALLLFSVITSFAPVSADAYDDCPDVNIKNEK